MSSSKKPRREHGSGSLWQNAPGQNWIMGVRAKGGKRIVRSSRTTNKTLAKKRLNALIREIENEGGTLPPNLIGYTFHQAAALWLNSRLRTSMRPNSKNELRIIVECHLAPYFKGRKLHTISSDDVEAYLWAKKRGRMDNGKPCPVEGSASTLPLSQSVLSKHLNALRNIFAFAQRNRLLKANALNPVASLSIRDFRSEDIQLSDNGVRSQQKFFTKAQAKALLDAAKQRNEWGETLYVRLMLELGLRIGEVSALTSESYDASTRQLNIHSTIVSNPEFTGGIQRLEQFSDGNRENYTTIASGQTKTNAGQRVLVLNAELAELFEEQLESPERKKRLERAKKRGIKLNLVFLSRIGTPVTPNNFRNGYWYRIMEDAGLQETDLTPHHLRHTFASMQIERGTPITTVSHWLGHANPQITASIYSHAINNRSVEVPALDFED